MRVLLIGAGQYAFDAHLPAVKRDAGVELAGVVDLESREESVRLYLTRMGWKGVPYYAIPDSCNSRRDSGAQNTGADAIPTLEQKLAGDDIHAVIVSTYGCHYEYSRWALSRGWHVLVDEPLTILPGMATNPMVARHLVKHFAELTELALEKRLLFCIATQRRYSEIYKEIARELLTAADSPVHSSVNFVRSIQAFTSDGYFLPFANYTFGTLGGKVKNTGYHVIDIVTWLLRAVTSGIDKAVIQVSPLCIDHLAELAGERVDNLSANELYASIQVTFRKGDVSYCVFQFHAQHENFAVQDREAGRTYQGGLVGDEIKRAIDNRTKEEELRIALGPYFRAYFRRVAKVTERAGYAPGER
jgi:predicted dehydrogenase